MCQRGEEADSGAYLTPCHTLPTSSRPRPTPDSSFPSRPCTYSAVWVSHIAFPLWASFPCLYLQSGLPPAVKSYHYHRHLSMPRGGDNGRFLPRHQPLGLAWSLGFNSNPGASNCGERHHPQSFSCLRMAMVTTGKAGRSVPLASEQISPLCSSWASKL